MLGLFRHHSLLTGDLPRLASFASRSGVDPLDGFTPERDAQVVAPLRELERRGARGPLLTIGAHRPEKERRFTLTGVEGQRRL